MWLELSRGVPGKPLAKTASPMWACPFKSIVQTRPVSGGLGCEGLPIQKNRADSGKNQIPYGYENRKS